MGEEIDERLKLAREAMEAAKTSRKVHKIKDHGGLKAVIEKRDFAGMVMEVEKTYKEGSKEAKAAEEKENLKGQKMKGLDALIAKIEKSKKMSVLDKTKMDWKKVKDSNEEIDEELEMHRKSKNTYTEQQSFLQQAEYREYEKERDARLAGFGRGLGFNYRCNSNSFKWISPCIYIHIYIYNNKILISNVCGKYSRLQSSFDTREKEIFNDSNNNDLSYSSSSNLQL